MRRCGGGGRGGRRRGAVTRGAGFLASPDCRGRSSHSCEGSRDDAVPGRSGRSAGGHGRCAAQPSRWRPRARSCSRGTTASAGVPAWAGSGGSGPAFDVPQNQLDAALTCGPGTTDASRPVALFIAGTTLTPDENFSWNYFRAFTAAGRPFCSVELPNHAMSDIQVSAEYVVNAIRAVAGAQRAEGRDRRLLPGRHDRALGAEVLAGHPLEGRRAHRHRPVQPRHPGRLPGVRGGGVRPAFWQQQTFSHFSTALNSGPETFAGINYTSMFTPTDEVVVPNLPPAPSSALTTGAGRPGQHLDLRRVPGPRRRATSRWARSTRWPTPW